MTAPVANAPKGIALMLAAVFIFALQDAVSRHLAETYNVWMVLMIRFWVMAAVVIALALRRGPDLWSAVRPHYPKLQALRSVILIAQTALIVICFTKLGLINTHAVFAASPLIGAALSGPILGERVGWRRWLAIAVGFSGVLIILQPGAGAFSPMSVVVLGGALLFAVYGLLTRYVSREDGAAVSLFWVGIAGAVLMTPPGLLHLEPMAARDVPWMMTLSVSGMLAHWLMIRAFELAEPSVIQPFSYSQLVFVSVLGVLVFDEELRRSVVIGTMVVIGAGIFTILRAAHVARVEKAAALLRDKGA